VRVSGCAVFAGRLASLAAAVAALVDDDARTDRDIVHFAATLNHFAGDFMAEDLRHLVEGNGAAVFIAVKIGLATVDVKVRATDTDRSWPQPHIVGAEIWRWDFENLKTARSRDCTGAHHFAAV